MCTRISVSYPSDFAFASAASANALKNGFSGDGTMMATSFFSSARALGMIATAVSSAANTVSRIKRHLSLEGICMEKPVVFGLGFNEGGWIRMSLNMGVLLDWNYNGPRGRKTPARAWRSCAFESETLLEAFLKLIEDDGEDDHQTRNDLLPRIPERQAARARWSTPMTSAPTIVPQIVPRPPARDVPPSTTAAIALSS